MELVKVNIEIKNKNRRADLYQGIPRSESVSLISTGRIVSGSPDSSQLEAQPYSQLHDLWP